MKTTLTLQKGKTYLVTPAIGEMYFILYLGNGEFEYSDGTKGFLIDSDVVEEVKYSDLLFKIGEN